MPRRGYPVFAAVHRVSSGETARLGYETGMACCACQGCHLLRQGRSFGPTRNRGRAPSGRAQPPASVSQAPVGQTKQAIAGPQQPAFRGSRSCNKKTKKRKGGNQGIEAAFFVALNASPNGLKARRIRQPGSPPLGLSLSVHHAVVQQLERPLSSPHTNSGQARFEEDRKDQTDGT
jgi:hypothetical protein